jgi:hypothetical protein
MPGSVAISLQYSPLGRGGGECGYEDGVLTCMFPEDYETQLRRQPDDNRAKWLIQGWRLSMANNA